VIFPMRRFGYRQYDHSLVMLITSQKLIEMLSRETQRGGINTPLPRFLQEPHQNALP